MKKVLLLGGSYQQIIAITTAKKLGYYTVLCDYLPDNPGQYHCDKFYLVSTTDKEAVLKVAEEENVDGVLAYASDPAAPTAAYVAEKMGLPGNPYQSVEILCNKDKFRKFLAKNGFDVPNSFGSDDKAEIFKNVTKLQYPIIIKPTDSSGSKGVTVLKDHSQLDEALDKAFSYSRVHRIIVEEYIERKHPYLIGGDIFVLNGKIIQWGLMNCHRDDSVNPLVPVGKSYPPLLDDKDLRSIKETLQDLVKKLDIQFGPMNVEVLVDRNDKVYLIDIGPRNGGNMIPDLLGYIFNCDIVEMTIRCAMGQPIVYHNNDSKLYQATYNLHSEKEGVLKDIVFSEKIKKKIYKQYIYKEKGEHVNFFENASHALGIIFLSFDSFEEMLYMMDNGQNYIDVVVEEKEKE